jgi:hypothetical protein
MGSPATILERVGPIHQARTHCEGEHREAAESCQNSDRRGRLGPRGHGVFITSPRFR